MILAFLPPLQNVLYMGILAMPSKIYIVINYIGGTVEKLTGFLQARPETSLNSTNYIEQFTQ